MKLTYTNVKKYAEDKGLEPIQIDGIPEGFSFIEPDLTIGDITYTGNVVAFIPNGSLETGVLKEKNLFELLEKYINATKTRYGK